MSRILIFGGTTEGRLLAQALARRGVPAAVSVATVLGAEELSGLPGITPLVGRKTAEEMAALLAGCDRCVDATHPYAREVSANIRSACRSAGVPLRRLLRRESQLPPGSILVGSPEEAAQFLQSREGNVLLAIGAKGLSAFSGLDPERLYPRVLPVEESLLACRRAGVPTKNIIAMHGPFSQKLNEAILEQIKEEHPDWTEEQIDEEYQLQRYGYSDIIGKSGLEYAMEDELRGERGQRLITTDAQGNVLSSEIIKQAVPGNTIVTTIDKDLQRAAIQGCIDFLEMVSETYAPDEGGSADRISVVAQDVKTGEILAMVNYPTYDLSDYYTNYAELSSDPLRPLINYCTQGVYMPGSIYKPVVAIGGLASGVIDADTLIDCQQIYQTGTSYNPRCLGLHGPINVQYALMVSCNYFFYETGTRQGIDNIVKYSEQLGLGVESGIELSEATGHISSPEYYESVREGQTDSTWTYGNVLQSAIGQLDNAYTPLQMANYTATLANNGTRMRSHLVKSIESYNLEETVSTVEPEVLNQVEASADDFEQVRQGMIRCATDATRGSARYYFADYPITVAAKTGTPQASGGALDATSIAYAPADDPEIAVAVVVENGYSGQRGAPVARAVFNEYFGLNEEDIQQQNTDGQLIP